MVKVPGVQKGEQVYFHWHDHIRQSYGLDISPHKGEKEDLKSSVHTHQSTKMVA